MKGGGLTSQIVKPLPPLMKYTVFFVIFLMGGGWG